MMRSDLTTIRRIACVSALAVACAAAGQTGTPHSPEELALWNSPEFRTRIVESYAAESDIEPRVTTQEREQLQKILDAIANEKFPDAVKLLDKHGTEASSAVFDFIRGNLFFKDENFEEAVKHYETATRKFKNFRRAWQNLGIIHIRNADYRKSSEALTKVIELGGGTGMTYGMLGFAYTNLEDNLSAESAFRMAILLDGSTKDWKMGLARSFFKQQRFSDAAALLTQLIEAEPSRVDLWMLQANAFIGLNQPLRAAENYEIIDSLGGSTADSLAMLGDIYVNEELYDIGASYHAKAIAKSPDGKPDRALRAARVIAARGAVAETKSLLDAIDTTYGERLEQSQKKDVLKLRARIAMLADATEEEAKILQEIVATDPLDGEALILLGQYFARTNEPEKAIFHYERAASIEKFEADARVRHAQLLVSQRRYAEALPLLRKAQQVKPRENIQEYLEQVEKASRTRS
jgi:tetratricopeptide (TPR) repeat protein